MSMANLLPWRQQRRARCLRFWYALFTATLLVTLAVALILRMNSSVKRRALQTELTGMYAVQHALNARRSVAIQTPPTTLPPQIAWQPMLDSLSDVIPAQVWLTALRYQPPSLMLTGYAATLPALSAMADALKRITGFSPGTAGELQQDSQGRWMFTFQLNSRG
ncbi:PilN domain-containing protein [Enterobacter oligotrophicus]|uniref:PilN domain-containing protein n=1 Tax=Enterobacter TaxID=547 RepID=UPI001C02E079|nr:PilN domain-containing protein [Enterobacter oligotrophicus]ELW1647423.1 PilN domain-containing protein [Enterobacter oligotrophicus]MBT9427051.1 PilN domain-containing protein [Enterobacter oligotrophicus]